MESRACPSFLTSSFDNLSLLSSPTPTPLLPYLSTTHGGDDGNGDGNGDVSSSVGTPPFPSPYSTQPLELGFRLNNPQEPGDSWSSMPPLVSASPPRELGLFDGHHHRHQEEQSRSSVSISQSLSFNLQDIKPLSNFPSSPFYSSGSHHPIPHVSDRASSSSYPAIDQRPNRLSTLPIRGHQQHCSCSCCPHVCTRNMGINYGFQFNGQDSMRPPHRHNRHSLPPTLVPDLRIKESNWWKLLKMVVEEEICEGVDWVFSTVREHVWQLMLDSEGNLIFQMFLMLCSNDQVAELINIVTADPNLLFEVSCNENGAKAMEKLIEYCKAREQISKLTFAVGRFAVAMAMDSVGHHIVGKCLRCFSYEDNKYILDAIAANLASVARDKFGCIMVQRCLDLAQGHLNELLVTEIIANAFVLAQNVYGNYLVQDALSRKVPHITTGILQQLKGFYVWLSTQKYSSNVVEKCLKDAEYTESMKIILELLHSPRIMLVLEDQYGNYVIQSALEVAKGNVYKALVDVIQKHMRALSNNPYGKKIVQKIMGRRSY